MLFLTRYSVKLLCDEAALGEAGDFAELSDSLQTYQSHYHIGREGKPDWNTAVLNQIPNLFSMGKSLENNVSQQKNYFIESADNVNFRFRTATRLLS